jgi:hypothetical protein
MSKNMMEKKGPQITSQYGAYAVRAGLARLYTRMCMHMPTRSGTPVHACTNTHAHTGQYIVLIAFPRNSGFVNAPLLRYTYIACLVLHYFTLRVF